MIMKKEPIVQTAGRNALGRFAPDFARYNDDILFEEVWNDEALSPKQRSMLVLATFMGRGLTDSSLVHHLRFAKENGLTRDEFVALVTQGGFYSGWPMAWALFNMGKEIFDAPQTLEEYAKTIDYPIGNPNNTFAQYFDGQSYLAAVGEGNLPIFNVTFEPGCRNHWHIHHAKQGGGQVLIGVGGKGYYQEWGKDPVEILPGTVIEIPPNVKHWHGAADDSWFSHLAIEVPGVETSNEWCESAKE